LAVVIATLIVLALVAGAGALGSELVKRALDYLPSRRRLRFSLGTVIAYWTAPKTYGDGVAARTVRETSGPDEAWDFTIVAMIGIFNASTLGDALTSIKVEVDGQPAPGVAAERLADGTTRLFKGRQVEAHHYEPITVVARQPYRMANHPEFRWSLPKEARCTLRMTSARGQQETLDLGDLWDAASNAPMGRPAPY
jgi:hypothetical protein